MDDVVRVDFTGGDKTLERAVEKHPAGKGVDEKERALLEAVKWANRLELAREEYGKSLEKCRDLGLGYTVIARELGKTEAAVRMFLGRRGK